MMPSWPAGQPTLTAQSIVLRPWRIKDAPMIYRACQDADIQRFTTVPRPYCPEHAEEFVVSSAALFLEQRGVNYAICDVTGQALGSIGFVAIDPTALEAEIGYWMATWGRGHGFAAAAVELLADWGRSIGLQEFIVRIDPDNAPSLAVAAAAGAVDTGRTDQIEARGATTRLRVFRLARDPDTVCPRPGEAGAATGRQGPAGPLPGT